LRSLGQRQAAVWEVLGPGLCGTAPIPASSGRTDRHRLNRGGDRHPNNALWRIALVRMHCHPPTRAYVERRTQQGLSKLDIMCCLKRYIAREVYQHLTSPHPVARPLA
jgi:transposase